MEKINADELRIEKLEPGHKELLISFQTSNKELKDFLVEGAMKNQELLISTTYIWFYTKTEDIVAYTTLLSDSLRIRETDLEKFLLTKVFYTRVVSIENRKVVC